MYPLRRTGLINQNKIVSGWPFDNVITVSATDPDADYATIAAAIAAASAGDVIDIDPGVWTETLMVSKAITLRGRDRDNTEITSSTDFTTTVALTAVGAKLLNLKITHTGTGLLDNCVGVTADDCVIENCILEKSSASNTGKGVENTGGTGLIVRETTITISGATAFNRCYDGHTAANDVEFIRCTLEAAGTGASEISMNHASAVATITETVLVNGTVTINANLGIFNGTLQDAFLVKNVSGAPAVFGDVGFLDEAGEYQTTTTEADDVAWCVVVIGDDDDDDIFIKRRGNASVNYAGAAPSAGDFLITSTTGGSAKQQVTMRPEVFAVATAAGAGGTIETLLLTGTEMIMKPGTQQVSTQVSIGDTFFTGTLSADPVGATFTYTVSTGNENSIKPAATNLLAKLRVYNSTRSEYALIQDVDTGTNTITVTSAGQLANWLSGDSITAESQTVTTGGAGGSAVWYEYEFVTELPALTRGIQMLIQISDTAANKVSVFHPFETFNGAKVFGPRTEVASVFMDFTSPFFPIFDNKFVFSSVSNGAATKTILTKLFAIAVANS